MDDYDSFELEEQTTEEVNRSRIEKRRSAILQGLKKSKNDRTLGGLSTREEQQKTLVSESEIKQQYEYAMEMHVKAGAGNGNTDYRSPVCDQYSVSLLRV